MRPVLVLVIIVLLMILGGWLTFTRYGDRTSINIETERIESDTHRALDQSRQIIDKTIGPPPVVSHHPAGEPVVVPIQ